MADDLAPSWSGWRGPHGCGVLEDGRLPELWSSSSGSIRWRTPIEGKGFSSPILIDEQVVVTTAYAATEGRLPADASLGAVALLAALAWSRVLLRSRTKSETIGTAVGAGLGWLVWILLAGCGGAFLMQDFVWATVHTVLLVALGLALFSLWVPLLRASPTKRLIALWALPVGGWALWATFVRLPVRYGFLVFVLTGVGLFGMALWFARRRAGESLARTLVACERAVARAAPLAWVLIVLGTSLWPLSFWDESTAQHVWRRSGLLATFGLALAMRWLPVRGPGRRLGSLVLLAAGAALWWFIPRNTVNLPATIEDRTLTVIPVAVCALWLAFLSPRAEKGAGNASAALAWLLFLLSSMVFARGNLLQPRLKTIQAVVCLDGRDGRVLWKTEVFEATNAYVSSYRTSHASPTPCSDGRSIVVHFGNGTACLDRTGRVRWKHESPEFTSKAVFGAGTSPLLVGDTVVILQERERVLEAAPSSITAFELASGEPRWRRVLDDARSSYGTPILIEFQGRRMIVAASWRSVVGFDTETGEVLWSKETEVEEVVTSPVHEAGRVYVAGGSMRGKTLGFALPTAEGAGAELLWETTRSSTCCSSPVLLEGRLFTLSRAGILSCYEAATGHSLWSERLPPGDYYASLAAGDGRVYATSAEGLTTVVAAAGEFTILAENDLGEAVFASPALGPGFLLMRGEEHLFRVDAPRD